MNLKVVDLNTNRPHVTAKACCEACQHEWVAVAPAGPGGEGPDSLECPVCHANTDAARHARVKHALEVVDDLREKLRTGQIVAFLGVGIKPDDTTLCWATRTEGVTRLRAMGAIAHLQHSYMHGLDDE